MSTTKTIIPVVYLEQGVETVPELFFEHYDCPRIIQMNNPVGTGFNSYFRGISVPIGALRLSANADWFIRGGSTKEVGKWAKGWAVLGTIYVIYDKTTGQLLYIGKTEKTLEYRKKLHLKVYKGCFGAEPLLHDYIKDVCGGDWEKVEFRVLYEVPKDYLDILEERMVGLYKTPLNAVPGGNTGGGKRKHSSNQFFGCVTWDKNRKRFKATWTDSSGKQHLLYYGDSIDDAYAKLIAEFEKQVLADKTGRLEGVAPRPLQHYKTHLANKYPDDVAFFDWL